jgi:hypothetical protein
MKILSVSLELLQADSRTDKSGEGNMRIPSTINFGSADIHSNVIQCNVLFVLNTNRSNQAFSKNLTGTELM